MKPWLWIPAKLAHDLAPLALQVVAAFRDPKPYSWNSFTWRGLHFENRLGIAGGVDKDGSSVEDWWSMGTGFVEVGTVTPRAQGPNPGKIIARDFDSRSLWNKMGFPGAGAEKMRTNLLDLPDERATPVFVNIGKNRDTPNEHAAKDYVSCIETLAGVADAFVVNISSPNTQGLRDLFGRERFKPFLREILLGRAAHAPNIPVLLKLSPDLDDESLESIVSTASELNIDGFIATNTTLTRSPGTSFPTEGGMSGAPLAPLSKAMLERLVKVLGAQRKGKLLISAGGVMSPEDVAERLLMGADLVQVYTALIYEGLGFFSHVHRHMSQISNSK